MSLPRSPIPGNPELPLPDGRRLSAEGSLLLLDGAPLLRLEGADGALHCQPLGEAAFALQALAYWRFSRDPDCQRLALALPGGVPEALLESGLVRLDDGAPVVERAAFWQQPGLWQRGRRSAGYPEQPCLHASGRRHPRRPPKPQGELYRRFDARLGAWVGLRSLDIETDLARFNRWQNHPRVAAFWQEQGDLAQHRRYLEALAADPRVLTLIGAFDDEPFAYYEAYWAKEDRIAPFYAVDDYDRGIHMLVGEDRHRGPHKVAAWLGALAHYLFLDEPRTRRLVCEPRADNARMIQHLQALGFARLKEFDFPHKRAALMVLEREAFFARCRLA